MGVKKKVRLLSHHFCLIFPLNSPIELRQAAVNPHSPGSPYDDAGGAKGRRGQRETAQWRREKQVSVFPPVLFFMHLSFPDSSEHISSLSVSPRPVKFPVFKGSLHPKKFDFVKGGSGDIF